MFTLESTERDAKLFSSVLYDAMVFAGEKQESIARKLGVDQASLSMWMDPSNSRNFPAALFYKLPKEMKQFITQNYYAPVFANNSTTVNGSIADELAAMLSPMGRLSDEALNNPKKSLEYLTQLQILVENMRVELVEKLKVK